MYFINKNKKIKKYVSLFCPIVLAYMSGCIGDSKNNYSTEKRINNINYNKNNDIAYENSFKPMEEAQNLVKKHISNLVLYGYKDHTNPFNDLCHAVLYIGNGDLNACQRINNMNNSILNTVKKLLKNATDNQKKEVVSIICGRGLGSEKLESYVTNNYANSKDGAELVKKIQIKN